MVESRNVAAGAEDLKCGEGCLLGDADFCPGKEGEGPTGAADDDIRAVLQKPAADTGRSGSAVVANEERRHGRSGVPILGLRRRMSVDISKAFEIWKISESGWSGILFI